MLQCWLPHFTVLLSMPLELDITHREQQKVVGIPYFLIA